MALPFRAKVRVTAPWTSFIPERSRGICSSADLFWKCFSMLCDAVLLGESGLPPDQRGNIESVSTLLPVSAETTPRSMVLDPPLTDATKDKMERWIENGAALGWLIHPYQRKVYIYEPGRKASVSSGKVIQGKGSVEGFPLDLDEVWRCYEI